MDSIDPAFDGEEMQHCHKVLGVFFKASGEPAHVLHFAEEAFDNVAHGIEVLVMSDRIARITL